jgi:hypothetical protein
MTNDGRTSHANPKFRDVDLLWSSAFLVPLLADDPSMAAVQLDAMPKR